jgi:hypothetical protein
MVAMFVIVHLLTTFLAQFIGMFIVYLCTKLHTPSWDGLVVITVGLKAKDNFRTTGMFVSHSTKVP